jgi:hypothetical protein
MSARLGPQGRRVTTGGTAAAGADGTNGTNGVDGTTVLDG